jgi:hypothetical protein
MWISSNNRIGKVMRWSGRIIGLILGIGSMVIIIMTFITSGFKISSIISPFINLVFFGLLLVEFFSIIISWWKELLASILLFACCLILIGIGIRTHFYPWIIILTLLYLLIGIFFLGSWSLTKKLSNK